jgi:lysophospholipase L1-like esterase
LTTVRTVLFIVVSCATAWAQFNSAPRAGVQITQSNPDGVSCATATAAAKLYQGTFYTCKSGVYTAASTASGASPDFRASGMALLPTWRTKLANVFNGTSDARILFVGDSTTWGAYGANYPANTTSSGWPALMSKMLPASLPVSNASATPQAAGTADSRVVLSGAFVQSNLAAGFAHWCYSVNGAGTLVFTPADGVSYDSFTIYTQGGQGGGTISATATGGTTTNIVQAYSNTVVKTTVKAASAGTSNSVTLSWVSGTSVQVIGIEAFHSSVRRIRFANAGFSGSTTNVWTDSNTSLTAIKAWAPDLTIIMLGINDAQSSVSPTTYRNNVQTIISNAKLSGDVVVMSMVPVDPSLTAAIASEKAYAALLPALAEANSIPFLDMFTRFGNGSFVSPMMANTLHPNAAGYADMARFVHGYLF